MRIEKFHNYYNLTNLINLEKNGQLYLAYRKKDRRSSNVDTIVSIGAHNYHIGKENVFSAELIYLDKSKFVRDKIIVNDHQIDIIAFLEKNNIAYLTIGKSHDLNLEDNNREPLLVGPNGIIEVKYSWFDCWEITIETYYKAQTFFINKQAVSSLRFHTALFPYMYFDQENTLNYLCKSITDIHNLSNNDIIKIKNECIKKEAPKILIKFLDERYLNV